VEKSLLLPPQKHGPWCNLSHPGEGGTSTCQTVSSQSSHRVQQNFLHPRAWFHCRESAKLLVPVETEMWAGALRGEGAQEMTLLPGSPRARKEPNACSSFSPVQRSRQSEDKFLWFCCSENSLVNILGLPAHILIAQISHKPRFCFSFAKVLFSNVFN